jgi:hypothetical protein
VTWIANAAHTEKIIMPKQSRKTVGWYFVAFIDVLGQRHLLREMRDIPEKTDQKEMGEFIALLKKTVGTVTGMRDLFHNFFEGLSGYKFDLSPFTPEQQKILSQVKSNPLKSHMFSDSVLLYFPLRDDVNKVPVGGVYSALAAAASTSIVMLASGHAIRGGIDVGVGIELSDTEVYGSALSRAYELERRTAQYPRIVLGDSLITYIQSKRSISRGDFFAAANKITAELCAKLIAIDADGVPFLDYLGEGFKQHIAKDSITDIVKKAYDFVMQESSRCQETRDSKLAFRYTLLRNYFEARLHLWPNVGQLYETEKYDS